MVDWDYYKKYEWADDKYLPAVGEGETMATQIVTAVSKLVYRWYNDGDVYDNTYSMQGWCNNLSSYANWLVKYTDKATALYIIPYVKDDDDYEELLWKLTTETHDPEYLAAMDKEPKQGSIYKCDGPFRFEEQDVDW